MTLKTSIELPIKDLAEVIQDAYEVHTPFVPTEVLVELLDRQGGVVDYMSIETIKVTWTNKEEA